MNGPDEELIEILCAQAEEDMDMDLAMRLQLKIDNGIERRQRQHAADRAKAHAIAVDASNMNVTANHPTTSSFVDDGADVAIIATLADGRTFSGSVTLVRDHTGEYTSWGDPTCWLSQALLDAADASGDNREAYALILSEAQYEIDNGYEPEEE